MKDHFNISDEDWEELNNSGIYDMDLMEALPSFDPNDNKCELGKLSLMYFIDKHGDFSEDDEKPLNRIAMAIFNNLPDDEKADVLMYLSEED